MRRAEKGRKLLPFPRPDGVVDATVCQVIGLLAQRFCKLDQPRLLHRRPPATENPCTPEQQQDADVRGGYLHRRTSTRIGRRPWPTGRIKGRLRNPTRGFGRRSDLETALGCGLAPLPGLKTLRSFHLTLLRGPLGKPDTCLQSLRSLPHAKILFRVPCGRTLALLACRRSSRSAKRPGSGAKPAPQGRPQGRTPCCARRAPWGYCRLGKGKDLIYLRL